MQPLDLFSIVTIALLGSFGHCIGMCGGIVIAYSSSKIDMQWGRGKQALAHLLYSLGRVTTYSLLGAIFGALGAVATLTPTTNAVLLLVAGIAMILAGLSLLGKVRFLTVIEHTLSNAPWYRSSFRRLVSQRSVGSFFLLGLLNGLLPCGFVYFFAIAAASSGDPLYGALIMAIFGLSTIPALFSLGFFVGVFKQGNFRTLMIKMASIAVVLYGLYTVYSGYKFYVDPPAIFSQNPQK